MLLFPRNESMRSIFLSSLSKTGYTRQNFTVFFFRKCTGFLAWSIWIFLDFFFRLFFLSSLFAFLSRLLLSYLYTYLLDSKFKNSKFKIQIYKFKYLNFKNVFSPSLYIIHMYCYYAHQTAAQPLPWEKMQKMVILGCLVVIPGRRKVIEATNMQ